MVFRIHFSLEPDDIKVYARKRDKSREKIKNNDKFDHKGDERIEFVDDEDVLHFFFPFDYAYVEGDSTGYGQQPVHRVFTTERGEDFLLVGVPYAWLARAPAGKIVIDPTVAVTTTDDVWIEDGINHNNDPNGLLVAKAGTYPKKRTLVKFDLTAAGIPATATIISARPVG